VGIEDASGKEVGWYKSSHSLLIGVSEYASFPNLRSIPGELAEVAEVLREKSFEVEPLVLNPDAETGEPTWQSKA